MSTRLYVPVYVMFVASLGPKFSYCDPAACDKIFEFNMIFENLKEKVRDFFGMSTITCQQEKFNTKLSKRSFRERTTAATKAQCFIELQMKLTKIFLTENSHVKIFRADKGGKVVITDATTYEEKMKRFIEANVNAGVYFRLDKVGFDYVKSICEGKYAKLIGILNSWFENDRRVGFADNAIQLVREPFIMSRIYGLFKINRADHPVRPIISSTNCMGKPLEKWILANLDVIAKSIGARQMRSARQLFNKLDGSRLKEKGHVLVTWDFDSMFTNIPFQKTKDIIRERYHLIQARTSVPVDVFLEALSFLVEDCAFFSFRNEIYLQTEGLSMGNSLSQVLAEITTSHLLSEALSGFRNNEISFIYKYVDDIIGGVDESRLSDIQESIEKAHGMKLKVSRENEGNEVDYLQMRIKRQADNSNLIEIRWVQKEYSSKSILNFHSFHPFNMKMNIVTEYMRNAFSLSSKANWKTTANLLRETLKNSNYSCRFVNDRVTKIFHEMLNVTRRHESKENSVGRSKSVVRKTYVSCPYYPGAMQFIRRSMKKANIDNVTLAPSIVSSNKNLIFSNLKDKRELSSVKNASFTVNCSVCKFSHVLFSDRYDVISTLRLALNDESSPLFKHHLDTSHQINEKIDSKSVQNYKSRIDLLYAKDMYLK